LELPKFPMKLLYKMQISVVREIQSRACVYVTSLQLTNEVKRKMELTIDHVNFERDTIKKKTTRMEKNVQEEFKKILGSAQENMSLPTEEEIEKINQAMESYRRNITELMELLSPSMHQR